MHLMQLYKGPWPESELCASVVKRNCFMAESAKTGSDSEILKEGEVAKTEKQRKKITVRFSSNLYFSAIIYIFFI